MFIITCVHAEHSKTPKPLLQMCRIMLFIPLTRPKKLTNFLHIFTFKNRNIFTFKNWWLIRSLRSDFDDTWCWCEDELESLFSQEKVIRASLPERNRSVLFGRISVVYLRYVVVARQLDLCYRHMLHVQKRRDIAALITAVCGRIIELKVILSSLFLILSFLKNIFIWIINYYDLERAGNTGFQRNTLSGHCTGPAEIVARSGRSSADCAPTATVCQ